ncbi:photosystem II assembly protein Psb35 [Leptolyngbya sp. AN02str]|uniref:photosystem II assembly protein Psb35 n=1 Tax=Leptolyngbya sp. AN02str TaxID=3423363 RepID=UPI003D314CEC
MVLNPILLVEPAVDATQSGASSALTIALGLGFIAAATLGSIAWYNSKRPPGWEDKERPDIVPDIDK